MLQYHLRTWSKSTSRAGNCKRRLGRRNVIRSLSVQTHCSQPFLGMAQRATQRFTEREAINSFEPLTRAMPPAQFAPLFGRVSPAFVILVVAALAVCWTVVLLTPNTPYYDQYSLLNIPFSLKGYPTFDDGLTSKLVGEGVAFLLPGNLVVANAVYRGVASSLYVIAAVGLATTMLTRRSQVLFTFALLATGYPLLWLSSELLAGACLCLALWLIVGRHSPIGVAIALTVFGLAKPDLLLPAVALAIVYVAIRRTTRTLFVVSYAIAMVAIVAPGILSHGCAFFATNRSFLSFGQHYAALISAQQHQTLPSAIGPWVTWRDYVQKDFPGAQSVIQAIRVSPGHY